MRATWIVLTAAAFVAIPVTTHAQAYNWSGVYVGLNAGIASGQSNTSSKEKVPFPSGPGLTHDLNRGGGAIGAQIGVNRQFAPNWLFGLEADLSYLHVNRTSTDWFDRIRSACGLTGTRPLAVGSAMWPGRRCSI